VLTSLMHSDKLHRRSVQPMQQVSYPIGHSMLLALPRALPSKASNRLELSLCSIVFNDCLLLQAMLQTDGGHKPSFGHAPVTSNTMPHPVTV
jgi:hypothetical protein